MRRLNSETDFSLRPPDEVREVIHAMSFALDNAGCGLTIQDEDLSYRFIDNLPLGWNYPESGEVNDSRVYGVLLGEKLTLAKMALLASGEAQRLTTMANDRVISFAINSIKLGKSGNRIVTVVQDITKVRRREATMRTLLLELSHRSKNLLAIIQGLATQSAKHARTLNEFIPAFIGRLHAVAGAQDVIVDSNWQRASLHELAKRQLQSISSDKGTSIQFVGTDIELDPNQSLHIGLALHELAMASAMIKDTTWRRITIEAGGGQDAFIRWKNEPGPNEPDIASDFGTTLLERVVPSAMSGHSDYHVTTDAIDWRIDFPLLAAKARTPRRTKRS